MEHLYGISHSILFSHYGHADFRSAYCGLDRIISATKETLRLSITDDEMRSGAHIKMKDIEAEKQCREASATRLHSGSTARGEHS